MKQVNKALTTISDLRYAVDALKSECDLLRNIVARYYAKYGEEIEGGAIEVGDEISFGITADEVIKCRKIDTKKVGIEGNYQMSCLIISKLDTL